MIMINNTIVSDAFLQASFACDLPRCKGDCCVSGDAGAPLANDEISVLEDSLDEIIPFMLPEGALVVKTDGVFDYDEVGNLVTPLVNNNACAFAGFHSNGTSFCAIEKAYLAGKIDFRKPISCHLYPVRLIEKDGFIHITYHMWSICVPAVRRGNREGIPLFRFLKEPLIRRFGEDWYTQLVKEIQKIH
jgi:hypothetical protein